MLLERPERGVAKVLADLSLSRGDSPPRPIVPDESDDLLLPLGEIRSNRHKKFGLSTKLPYEIRTDKPTRCRVWRK